MNWLGYAILFQLWTCCTLQNVFQGQAPVFTGQELQTSWKDSRLQRNCGPPPHIRNAMAAGSQRQDFPSGSTVIYICYRMYEMEGTPLAMCSDGQWVGVPRCHATCRSDDLEMEHNNIQVKWVTKSTSMTASDYWMEFECKRGFRKDPLSPPFVKQCLSGPWVYPRCI
ncbi:complement factor H-related protein 5-like [Hemicordylus capensis]|uniref:complement factor H-related protein 5-like n=1 Tax=Hemicordylus capensis TaxID=884348 RepID=UPI002304B527|nr:complement factor H-related protein 5-like [Hemicordylus capensis]XP_053098991.1 complement factor H-related protein 5-like [Hemicordylus capensis]